MKTRTRMRNGTQGKERKMKKRENREAKRITGRRVRLEKRCGE